GGQGGDVVDAGRRVDGLQRPFDLRVVDPDGEGAERELAQRVGGGGGGARVPDLQAEGEGGEDEAVLGVERHEPGEGGVGGHDLVERGRVAAEGRPPRAALAEGGVGRLQLAPQARRRRGRRRGAGGEAA